MKIIFFIINFYQLFISPNTVRACRFYPSCSEYMRQVIVKYGLIKGGGKSLKRILKCNPWNHGGVDLP